jgi:hypothetical protein
VAPSLCRSFSFGRRLVADPSSFLSHWENIYSPSSPLPPVSLFFFLSFLEGSLDDSHSSWPCYVPTLWALRHLTLDAVFACLHFVSTLYV